MSAHNRKGYGGGIGIEGGEICGDDEGRYEMMEGGEVEHDMVKASVVPSACLKETDPIGWR